MTQEQRSSSMDATSSSLSATTATSVPGSPAPAVAEPAAASRLTDVACRALDIAVSATLLVVLLPVFAVIAVVIRRDTPGRVIFRQRRLGRGQREFMVNKFRTMHQGVLHDTHREFVQGLIAGEVVDGSSERPFYKMSTDARITPAGQFLRRSSLDELPQLWNVLRGEMSLVGPRPPLSYEVEKYPAHWFGRFAVKPGVTGLWQVSGRSELTLEEMIRLDLTYAETRSLRLNLVILLRTIPAVLWARGAA
jgi:lipopolysaccharide/colanic/teichoic acid biosynthesis glycosyltransferase